MSSHSQPAREQPSFPTHLLPTSSPHPIHTHFNPAELATLRVLGLDPDLLIDAVEQGLGADLFEQIACNAALLSQIPRHERTGALLDIWLFKAIQQVKDETTMRKIQDLGIGDLTLDDRGIVEGLAQLMGSGSRYRLQRDGEERLVGMLPIGLAGEYRDAMALVDLDSLSERFSHRDPDGESISLNRTLRNRYTRERITQLTPRRYRIMGAAEVCERVPPIDRWPTQVIDAFAVGDWKFGFSSGRVVLLVLEGLGAGLLNWIGGRAVRRDPLLPG